MGSFAQGSVFEFGDYGLDLTPGGHALFPVVAKVSGAPIATYRNGLFSVVPNSTGYTMKVGYTAVITTTPTDCLEDSITTRFGVPRIETIPLAARVNCETLDTFRFSDGSSTFVEHIGVADELNSPMLITRDGGLNPNTKINLSLTKFSAQFQP